MEDEGPSSLRKRGQTVLVSWKAWNRSNRILLLILCLVLGTGTLLRFYDITQKGLFQWDAAYFLNFVRAARLGITWGIGNFQEIVKGTADLHSLQTVVHDQMMIVPFALSKPGQLSLIFLSSLFLGFRDYTSSAVSALLGSSTILLVYLLGTALYGRKAGLTASAVLAVSAFHVWISRDGKAMASSAFFLALGTYLYYLSRTSEDRSYLKLALAGLTLGFAFTCNGIVIWSLLLFAFYEGHFLLSRKPYLTIAKVKRWFLFGLTMLAPLVAFELITVPAHHLEPRLSTYFQLLAFAIRGNSVRSGRAPDYLFYIYYLWAAEGPLLCLFLASGSLYFVVRLVKRFNLADFIVLTQFLLPLLYLSAMAGRMFEVFRTLSPVLPAAALLVGKTVVDFPSMIRAACPKMRASIAHGIVVVITVALLLFGLGRSLQVMGLRTGYRQAAAWILEHGDGKVVSAVQTPIWQFYLRRRTYECYTLEELQKAYREEGVNYVTLDGRGKNSDVYRSGYLKEVEDTCQPVVVFDNSFIAYIPRLARHSRDWTARRAIDPWLRIYDLREFFGEEGGRQP